MRRFLQQVVRLGTSPQLLPWQNRNIMNTNGTALLLFAVISLLCITAMFAFGFETSMVVLIFMAMSMASIPVLNERGRTLMSRHLLSAVAVVGTLMVTIVRKHSFPGNISAGLFYTPRAALLMVAIIPFIVFHLRERRQLILSMGIALAGLLLFDPLHNALGVGAYQLGQAQPKYYFTNITYLCFYLFITLGVAFLKKTMEDYARENEALIGQLNTANAKAEQQNKELKGKSYILGQLLNEKDNDLADIAQELSRYNQELMQYSYTISHNLRGPVSSIMGLTQLYRLKDSGITEDEFLDKIDRTTTNLDHIIRGLNRIVDERQDKFQLKQRVPLDEEFTKVIAMLDDYIVAHRIHIVKDFTMAPVVFSVQVRIHFMLFTLISNAIQYRAADRATYIRVTSHTEDDVVVLKVTDNGSGIDMDRYAEKIFKPFSRFHPKASGTGLGLYLVKLQLEKMNGTIKVESTPSIGSTFQILLREALPA